MSLAIGFSFLCSVMEAVLLSVTPSFVAQTEKTRPRLGRRLKSFKDEVDRPLAAILSLNTIAHTAGAALAGSQAAKVYGEAGVGYFSAVLIILILVLSEIIPKTLGAIYWRQLSAPVVALLVPTIWSMWPLVFIGKQLTRLMTRGVKEAVISREELAALADLGAQEGIMHEGESRILKNLFRFNKVRASDIMTPRTVLFALPKSMTVAQARAGHPKIRFSRVPLYNANHDDIEGFVLKSDLLECVVEGCGETSLSELHRPLHIVNENLSLRALFKRFIDERAHIMLAVDEYGGTSGIVTMEDLFETLLGLEIVDEADGAEDMQELARQKWRERAAGLGLVIDQKPKPPTDEKPPDVETIGRQGER